MGYKLIPSKRSEGPLPTTAICEALLEGTQSVFDDLTKKRNYLVNVNVNIGFI